MKMDMRKKLLGKCMACILAAAVTVTSVSFPKSNVYATTSEETENEVITMPIVTETISAPETSVTYNSKLRSASATTSYVTQKDENAVRWIDRVNVEDYALEFYEVLEKNISDESGMLIDVTKASKLESKEAYAYSVTQFTGTADSKSAMEEELSKNMAEAGENIAAVFYAFDRDHPEVFWLDGGLKYGSGYTYSLVPKRGGISYSYTQTIYLYLQESDSSYDIRAEGYQDADTIMKDIETRDSQVDTIVEQCKKTSRYDTIKALNSWLTKNNGYNTIVAGKTSGTAPDTAWECISALEGKSGTDGPVCEGYARAFKVLCDKLEIPCVLVDGQAKSSSSATAGAHMWNYVQMEDNNWYAVDVTWNDPVLSSDSSGPDYSGDGNEIYLLVGGNTLNSYQYAFADSHVVVNEPSAGFSYKNGPVLSDKEYVLSDLLGVTVTPESASVLSGYSETQAPELTAEAQLYDGVTGTPSYQWYSVDESGEQTAISGATEETYKVPTGNDVGTYRYVVKATLDSTTMTSKVVVVTISSSAATEPTPTTDSTASTEPTPTTDSTASTEPTPTKDSEAATEPTPTTDSEASTEPTPTTDSEAATEPTPTTDSETATESTPTKDSMIKPAPTTEPASTAETAVTPTVAPLETSSTVLEKGTEITDSKTKVTYVVTSTSEKGRTVQYVKNASKKAKTVTIPATVKIDNLTYKVTSISNQAFKGNKSLKKVTIGKNVVSIQKNAFKGCTKLKTIIIKSVNLTSGSVGKNAFGGISAKATVSVPKKKLKLYKKLLRKKGLTKKTQKIKS
jgi:hypothetical protein